MTTRLKESLVAEIERQEEMLRDIDRQRDRSLARLADLREQLAATNRRRADPSARPAPLQPPPTGASESLPPLTGTDKLRLFRGLFRGRDDVYAKYWENPAKSRKGYSPACANEWHAGLCDKKRVRCGVCPNRAFLPVSDPVILDHFKGRHVIGVYPMLDDETCWFLAADFDKTSWMDDVAAFVETSKALGLSPAIERSRSGNGAHVWFFFSTPVAANVARRMGCYIVTESMARRHQLSMESYDRLFPNQDTTPRGGFGNLIALPFQGKAIKLGNTVFVDDRFTPIPDQGAYLAGLPRLAPDFVEGLAREASRTGLVVGVRAAETSDAEVDAAPWTRPPSGKPRSTRITGALPAELNVVLSQRLFVTKAGVPSALLNQVQRLAAFQNPEFYKKQRMRLSTRGTPRVISCAEDFPDHLAIPRGCQPDLEALLKDHGIKLALQDERHEGAKLDVEFRGELTPTQHAAARALLAHDTGVFVAPPGIGKTVLGTYLVASRRRSTLVLVHRQALLDQWLAQLAMFLGIEEAEIGRIGGGKKKPNGRLDVAMLQSLTRNGVVDDCVASYGQVVVDECHHLPAFSFERVLNQIKAKYIVGLTATPQRRDGHHPITEMQLGPTRFSVDAKSQAAKRPFDHRLIVRDTGYAPKPERAANTIQDHYRDLALDETRNKLIVDDVIEAIHEGRSPILLTERKDHLRYFAERLAPFVRHVVVLQGGTSRKEQKVRGERLKSIPDGEERLLLATGRYIGEGFDDARLDTLFLALPISFKGTLVQYTGRLHRLHPSKTEVRIFDFVDRGVPMLLKMFDSRLRGYRAIGYARDEAPLGFAPPAEELAIEYDEKALCDFDDEE